MTFLHYSLSELGHDWILACEDRPIAAFKSCKEALKAARAHIASADKRGDIAVLETRNKNTSRH